MTTVVSFVQSSDEPRLSFQEMTAIEPRLGDLAHRVRGGEFGRGDGAWPIWKGKMDALVGWRARQPQLCDSDSRNTASRYLLALVEANPRRTARTRKRRPADPGHNQRRWQ